MCDTIVIVGDGEVLFAKNSDRDPNEAQVLDWQPRRTHAPGAMLKCTHIEIPQVEETAAVLLSRPFWMWGAEMGTNEHGVTIGNEAVFTRQPYAKTGLLGMDLLRCALERSRTADEAVETITSLLAEHGQGGGCGYEDRSFTYHNSFIVADPAGAQVLETAGAEWAVETVKGARSISNGLTIDGFADKYSARFRSTISSCRTRRQLTESLAGEVDVPQQMASILRQHGTDKWPTYKRLNGTLHMPCMHGGSEIASSVSTGSWVSRLTPASHQHWATATSSPCLSLFKPVAVNEPLDLGTNPEGTADDSLWWTHERLHRRVMKDPSRLANEITKQRDETEAQWFANPPTGPEAFAEHKRLLAEWLESTSDAATDVRPSFAQKYWAKREHDSMTTGPVSRQT